MKNLPLVIVAKLKQALGTPTHFIPLHEPCFDGNESQYLQECIESTFVSSAGKFVDRFELELTEYTGCKHAVAVINGTCALQLALQLAGVQANDEVLVPLNELCGNSKCRQLLWGYPALCRQ